MAFLADENENRQMEDLLSAEFGRVPERYLMSAGTKSVIKTENYARCLFFECFNAFFHPVP